MDQTPKESTPNRTEITHHRDTLMKVAAAVAGGAIVALYFTKYRTTFTFCPITMDQLNAVRESGEGGFAFGMNTRNKIMVALPNKV